MEKQNVKVGVTGICGICSFAKYPIHFDIDTAEADFAILGAPYDMSIGYLSGTRLGPRRIREVSTHYARGDAGFYDIDRDTVFLASPCKIIDCGDVDIVLGEIDESLANIETSVRKLVKRGCTPVVMGGDHAISAAVARGLDSVGDFVVIQIDAHLDWSKQAHGNGNPMRMMSKLPYVKGMAQVGLRGLGSSRKEDYDEARAYGSVLIPAKAVKTKGIDAILDMIPDAKQYYVTIDIDGFDITAAPGAGSPSPSGLNFDEVNDLLEGITKKGNVIAFDLVEVAPQYDPTGVTTRVAAMTMLGFMGHIMKRREEKK